MRSFLRNRSAVALALAISAAVNLESANIRGGTTVPVMTALIVKLDEAVNVGTAANGAGFTANVKEPVQVDGTTVIPANSSAAGILNKQSQTAGSLELNSVFVNGRMYRITTEPVAFNQTTNLRAGATMTFHLVLSVNIAK